MSEKKSPGYGSEPLDQRSFFILKSRAYLTEHSNKFNFNEYKHLKDSRFML